MANIPISSLPEVTTISENDYLAVDNGTASSKIKVSKFNEESTTSAYTYMTRAETAATNAETSASNAQTYKNETSNLITSAQTLVSDAQTYAGNASTSAGTASSAATTATNKATEAANSASQAASYANNVDSFAKEAKSWARGGTGTRIGEDTDNAMYYANEAKSSEINAAASESNAASSESNAATSESNASASASSASTNALKAEGYAVGSQNGTPATSGETYYHDNAKYYKEEAATSATNASTSETNAGLSESAASSSASSAATSKEDSEAWAVGKRNGVDVASTDPAYHNNAKYYADQAGAATSGVSSWNSRSGNVVPVAHDYAANQVDYSNTTSGLTATDVQAAIDEVKGAVSTVAGDLTTLDGSLADVAKSGAYSDLSGLPTLGSAAALDVAASGDASTSEVVKGDDTRLTDARTPVSHTHTLSNITDAGTAAAKDSTNAVTQNSTNLIESGAVYTGLANEAATRSAMGAKNLLPSIAKTQTINGVTFTVNSDGSVTVNGTNSSSYQFAVVLGEVYLKAGTYKMSGCPSGQSYSTSWLYTRNVTDSINLVNDLGSGAQFTLSNTKLIRGAILVAGSATINLTFYPMIRLATDADTTYQPYAMTNQQITPYVQAISNPNLLDNPWFTVNQRGQSSYSDITSTSDTRIYTLDRWACRRGYVEDVTDGIKVFANLSGSAYKGQISQPLENFDSLLGRRVTLSVNFSEIYLDENEIDMENHADDYGVEIMIVNSTGTYFVETKLADLKSIRNSGLYRVTADIPSSLTNTFLTVVVRVNGLKTNNTTSNSYYVVKAVKLELGSVSTLAMDTAPNYVTELLKCQRYFHKYATQSLRPSNMYDCIPEMRATPTQSTITIDSTTYYVNSADL